MVAAAGGTALADEPKADPADEHLKALERAAAMDMAAPPPPAAKKEVVKPVVYPHEEQHRRFGLMVDAGVPDLANISIVYRPWSWLHFHGGGGYNGVSPGIRGGAKFVPFGKTWISPSATLEYGRYFEGNVNELANKFGADIDSPMLRRVGYDYANAHLGVELGWEWVTWYVHAGQSWVWTDIHGINEQIEMSSSETPIEFRGDTKLKIRGMSAKTGLIFYIMK